MRGTIFLLIFSAFLLSSCIDIASSGSQKSASNTENRTGPRRAEVLFLGHESQHHDSNKYAPWLAISAFEEGINITYTTSLDDINPENLAKYDGLVIYANHDTLSASQEAAMKGFVENGKGLIPLHCATGCFKNSDWYIETIGGQFASHGTGTFAAEIVKPEHPVMQGVSEFETWDETYVHQRINSDMTVLMERVEDGHREPYTWVRNQGKGRVFYTAYGHNDSTWTNSGFLQLVNNGIFWAIGEQVQSQIDSLQIPDVSIYDSTISKFTERHVVPKMQEALAPEESQKLIQVPVDFEIELFAAEPDITNPIAMAWDEKGRLWIVESVDYPNTFLETDGAANDRIKICEDTDGDGKADKFTVFADSLNIPTSMVFANDGVIVSMAPNFVFMKDTDGDDKADIRQNIISGWGKNDTHAGPSNLQYGFDNKVWGVLGYSGFEGEIEGKSLSFRQGIYRFYPDGSDPAGYRFEYLANSSNNTWGLGFSEDNNVFISTANNTHSAFYSMPAQYMLRTMPELSAQASSETQFDFQVNPIQKIDGHYDVHAMTPNLRQVDVVGGFTAAAGHHLYTARSFPKHYWNRVAFVTEPTVRVVHNAIIEPDGAGFQEKDGWNLMASSDEWFGPVQAQVGPDGAVWVADWYNFIIQHNVFVPRQAPSEMVLPFTEQPHGQGNAFISPLRDVNHGRIYRVVYRDAPVYKPITLSKDDTPGLLDALENDNMFWRMTAQRLLVENKDASAIPGLIEIINNQEVDEIGLNSPAVHALWTLHGLGTLGSNEEALDAAMKALSHPAAGVRKAAVSVLPRNQQSLDAIQKNGLINDPDLNVRMNTLLALAEFPTSNEIGEQIFEASQQTENLKDAWLRKALFAAAVTHTDGFLAASENATVSQKSAFTNQMELALNQEVYELPRRGALPFPVDVSKKEIVVKASIAQWGDREPEGVIMAQGGKNNGYALFIEKGKLNLEVHQNGKTYKAVSSKALPEKFEVMGRLAKDGEITLEVNSEQVAKGKAVSWFEQPLGGAIRMGYDFDNEDKIGSYEGDFRLRANLQKAMLELQSEEALKALAAGKGAGNQQGKQQRSDAVTINVKVVPDMMKYDKESFTVQAGQEVIIEFENTDGMQHNLLIVAQGALETVGLAADAMVRDPKAAQKNYVPDVPEVLHATKLLNPGEIYTLKFTAPDVPGEYPFVCTFPGHWRMMNGIMTVTGAESL